MINTREVALEKYYRPAELRIPETIADAVRSGEECDLPPTPYCPDPA